MKMHEHSQFYERSGRSICRCTVACLLAVALCPCDLVASEPESETETVTEKSKTISGTAEFLKLLPKHFAKLVTVNEQAREVSLLIEGELVPKIWTLVPDAELKVCGWWGRLEQFKSSDRVWVWFKLNRQKQPIAVCMLADELSEQDMHCDGLAFDDRMNDRVTFLAAKGSSRVGKASNAEIYFGDQRQQIGDLARNAHYYIQQSDDEIRLILDKTAFERRRNEQKTWLASRWAKDGLPGSVAFLHNFSGEIDLILDHEAMRWGRSLKPGDEVSLVRDPPIRALVKSVAPWRERTQLRLVVNGLDQDELTPGQRVTLRIPEPPATVTNSPWPSDLGRARTNPERVEWFLSSIYCTCSIGGDVCTGHFYTLSSCNPNGCGMPDQTRQLLTKKIEQGLNDQQIFDELLQERGPNLVRPHLTP